MPTEAGRHRLYETIKQQRGQDNADELMSYLPPVGWADVATKQDLALMSAEIRGEVGGKVAGLEAKLAGLEAKVAGLDGKIAGLNGKIDARIDGLRAEMERGFTRQTRWTVTTFVGMTGAFAAIVNWIG